MIVLDWDVEQCAQWLGDRDLEPLAYAGCRYLSNARWHCGGTGEYAPWAMNCTWSVWARMSQRNWIYLRQLVVAIGREYRYRFGTELRPCKVAEKMKMPNLERGRFIIPPLLVPERYWFGSVPHSYKLWYIEQVGKQWTRREDPWWIPVVQREERFECEVSHPGPQEVVRYAVPVGYGTLWGPRRRGPYSSRKLANWEKKMLAKKGIVRRELRGQDLACYCDGYCFGKILVRIANSVD